MPLLELKPNRIASGIPIGLFELEGDFRYVALFIIALVPLVVATQKNVSRRGWSLAWLGILVIFLTMLLPAIAGIDLLANVESFLDEDTNISNPRVLTAGAMATGLLGGYIILFGGLIDMENVGVPRWLRLSMGGLAPLLIVLMIVNGSVDIYSIMVEFQQRGETLGQRFIEHFVFVIVSLIAGLVVGIALGLWASRDSRLEPIILYAVGIIQTVPSLALYGILLVPMARLGNQSFTSVFLFFITTLLIGVGLLVVYVFVQRLLPPQLKSTLLILCVAVLLVPLGLLTTILITFGFEAVLTAFADPTLRTVSYIAGSGLLVFLALSWIVQRIDNDTRERRLSQIRWVIGISTLITAVIVTTLAGANFVSGKTLASLTIRDLGVAGIGTAPALIALTLYSLLPLVRNTYVGLTDIDPAVIDSGRGLGMTPSQIFFQIELPLAFPVIMAGVRNAGISLVGIAAIASIIGAGALGDFILLGVNSTSIDLILLGALPAILLAVILDVLMQLVEAFFTSPGIRQVTAN